ncbi:MAG: chloride channel protein [Desulfovibrionaceae bacterium]|nr:chloride channel protein [Desulfovibrionaceae bacterium]
MREKRLKTPSLWHGSRGRIWSSLLLWAGAVGIGCTAVLLAAAAGGAFAWFENMRGHWRWWPIFVLPLGGIALTWFIRRVGSGTEGSGIQQAVAALLAARDPQLPGRLINLRLALAKFIAIVGGMASGFVLGLEGPTVQIGASILFSLRRFFPEDTTALRRQLILAGGAAGIAAAFNAPLAGLIFAFEEMSHTPGHTSNKVVVAIILAGVVVQPVFGYQSYFGRLALSGDMSLTAVPALFSLALLGGLVGGGFSWLALRTDRWIPQGVQRLRHKHPYMSVAFCGLLIALLGMVVPIFGSGAETTRALLAGGESLPWQYLPCKFAGLVLTLLTGLPGGIFSPSLSMGAGLGSWFLPFAGAAWHAEFIAVGMVSVLAAVTRAPMTAAFIMIEMTDGHTMVLEMLGAAFLAAHVARFFRARFYHELAARILRANQYKEEF